MKRMLFNATHQEELRVAIVDGQKLIDLDIETAGREQRKGNIYKGVITRIEPGLEACFVNYGEERHGFLPFKEVARSYFKDGIEVRSARIQDALAEGQELIVQVEKEERGNKGAALTTFISLAGRHLVLMPNNPRGGGVSRRVEGEERQELRDAMDQLNIPQGMSVIARTAGIGRSVEELQWDLSYLQQLWDAIDTAARDNTAPVLIYLESSLVIRAIRDYFSPDIGEILIDTDDIADQATAFMSVVMPDNVNRVKRYRDDIPLFSRFQIEHQIETAYSRTVELPSGGAVVIDHTEALVAVDVNSARSTRGADIEETALRTNLEAADEVARQLRLRDLGGLIVIDFIDMEDSKNQRAVEQRLRDALRFDRARVQMGKISRFGLMELSRQRLRPALNEGSHITCPRCNGTGVIRDAESSALHILRLIQEEAMKDNTAAVHAQVPVDVATFLLNEKRSDIAKLEARLKVNVVLIPNKNLETPHHSLERLRHDDPRLEEIKPSFTLAEAPAEASVWKAREENTKPRQEALVKGVTPETPAPLHTPRPAAAAPGSAAGTGLSGLFKRIAAWFSGSPAETKPAVQPSHAKPAGARSEGSASRRQSDSRQQNGDRQRNRRNGNERRAPEAADAASNTATQQDRRQPRTPRNADARDAVRQHQVATRHQDAPAAQAPATDSDDGTPRNSRNRRSRSRGGRRDELTQNGEALATDTLNSTLPAAASAITASAMTEAAAPAMPHPAADAADAGDENQDLDTLRQDGSDDNGEADPERKRRRRRSRRGRRQGGDETGTQLDSDSNDDNAAGDAEGEENVAIPAAFVAAAAVETSAADTVTTDAIAADTAPAAVPAAAEVTQDALTTAVTPAPAEPQRAQQTSVAAETSAVASAASETPFAADRDAQAPVQAKPDTAAPAAAVPALQQEQAATAHVSAPLTPASEPAPVVAAPVAAAPVESAADATAPAAVAPAAVVPASPAAGADLGAAETAAPDAAAAAAEPAAPAEAASSTAAAEAQPLADAQDRADAPQDEAPEQAEAVTATVETVVEQAIQVPVASSAPASNGSDKAQALESVIAAAGLQWVETRSNAAAPAASNAPAVKLGRPRKAASAAPAPVSLQQVETADAPQAD
ncbi:Rne/Rng family ribonuclease [Kerstersia sp.]|uniref:Rne/Rng family ribonuclease n=1 Tax=Kerstersia sp. TaxID=1930783 RepID=UPI003F9241F0